MSIFIKILAVNDLVSVQLTLGLKSGCYAIMTLINVIVIHFSTLLFLKFVFLFIG
jgi:hypothetical protein